MALYVHHVPVRYLEVDQQGVVFNMWYLAYLDDAMTGLFSHIGFDYTAMLALGVDVQLVHVTLDWTGSAKFGDTVDIGVSVAKIGTTSLTLAFDVGVRGESVLRATIVYVCVATDGSGKCAIPEPLRTGLAPPS